MWLVVGDAITQATRFRPSANKCSVQHSPPSKWSDATRSYSSGRPSPRRLRSRSTTGNPCLRQPARNHSSCRHNSSETREGRKNTPRTSFSATATAARSASLLSLPDGKSSGSMVNSPSVATRANPTRTTASDAPCEGPGDTRITTVHRDRSSATGSFGITYEPERSRVTTSPRSRRTCKARDAVNDDTSYSSAISRTVGTFPRPHSPARRRVARSSATDWYFGCALLIGGVCDTGGSGIVSVQHKDTDSFAGMTSEEHFFSALSAVFRKSCQKATQIGRSWRNSDWYR